MSLFKAREHRDHEFYVDSRKNFRILSHPSLCNSSWPSSDPNQEQTRQSKWKGFKPCFLQTKSLVTNLTFTQCFSGLLDPWYLVSLYSFSRFASCQVLSWTQTENGLCFLSSSCNASISLIRQTWLGMFICGTCAPRLYL